MARPQQKWGLCSLCWLGEPVFELGYAEYCFTQIWASLSSSSSLCTSPGGRGAQAFFWRAVLVCLVLGCFGVVVTSFSAMLLSWSIRLWMLVAVVLSLFGLSENISLLYTLYSPTRCRTSRSSRTCFWVSTSSPHALQVWFRYLFL